MTLDEARRSIGREVKYWAYPGATPEIGVITSVSDRYTFVRYGEQLISKATPPNEIVLAD